VGRERGQKDRERGVRTEEGKGNERGRKEGESIETDV